MNRSRYNDDVELDANYYLFRANVDRSIKGRRGQAFLRELAAEMDAMPERVLIEGELIDAEGNCCAIGVVCKARGLDVTKVDDHEPDEVGALVGISRQMAAEIAYMNDEEWSHSQTLEQRWTRMRKWVAEQLK